MTGAPAHLPAVLYTRDDWGAVPAKRSIRAWRPGQPTSKTAHYTARDVPVDAEASFFMARLRDVQEFHLDHAVEDWADIAYNFAVDPLGNVYECRGWDVQSGAQREGNPFSLAVVYLGGPATPFTSRAQRAFAWIGEQRPGPWYRHAHWGSTTDCPGHHVGAWVDVEASPLDRALDA